MTKLKNIQKEKKAHPDKTIKIKKEKLVCGIFNPWIGGGSLLGIELDQDITVPASLIHPGKLLKVLEAGSDINYPMLDKPLP